MLLAQGSCGFSRERKRGQQVTEWKGEMAGGGIFQESQPGDSIALCVPSGLETCWGSGHTAKEANPQEDVRILYSRAADWQQTSEIKAIRRALGTDQHINLSPKRRRKKKRRKEGRKEE